MRLQRRLQNPATDGRRDLALLAQLDHAMGFELGDDGVDHFRAQAVARQAGADAHALKEITGAFDGGGVDFEKAAHTLLQDYRDGALGGVSLESPETRAQVLAEFAEQKRIKTEQKAERERQRQAFLENNRRTHTREDE